MNEARKDYHETRVYRLLYHPDLFLTAYGRISRNQGAMTKGTTEETADGMTMNKIHEIIEDLRHERYQFRPARRVDVPKKNGAQRPLGVQSWSDKLVPEGISSIAGRLPRTPI